MPSTHTQKNEAEGQSRNVSENLSNVHGLLSNNFTSKNSHQEAKVGSVQRLGKKDALYNSKKAVSSENVQRKVLVE